MLMESKFYVSMWSAVLPDGGIRRLPWSALWCRTTIVLSCTNKSSPEAACLKGSNTVCIDKLGSNDQCDGM